MPDKVNATRIRVAGEVLAEALFPGLECRVENAQRDDASGLGVFILTISGPDIPDAEWSTVTLRSTRQVAVESIEAIR